MHRSNAHTLDWDGNAWFAGDVYIGGTGQDDPNAVKLATVQYIDEQIGKINRGLKDILDIQQSLIDSTPSQAGG